MYYVKDDGFVNVFGIAWNWGRKYNMSNRDIDDMTYISQPSRGSDFLYHSGSLDIFSLLLDLAWSINPRFLEAIGLLSSATFLWTDIQVKGQVCLLSILPNDRVICHSEIAWE